MPITGAPPGAPLIHAGQHENGGADEIDVGGLSGQLADPQFVKPHAASHMDGGADELDAADLAGADGAAGEVLTSDGAAASWVAPPAAGLSAWGSYVGDGVLGRRILTGFLCHMVIVLCVQVGNISTWTVLNVSDEETLQCAETDTVDDQPQPYLHAADGFVLGGGAVTANRDPYLYRYMAFG